VAYLAAAIAAEYGLDNGKMINVIIASLLHDIGVMLQTEFRELSKFDSENSEKMSHSYVGAFLIDKVKSFRHLSPIISKHHLKWINHPDTEEEALIIHLSDRIDILLKRDAPAYYQRETVKDTISAYSGKFFKPEHVEAFLSLYEREHFWLDIEAPDKDKILKKNFSFDTLILDKDEILSFTNFLSHLIDFRCSFTATHSAGVAAVASKLGELLKLPEFMVTNLKIAGFLHDLGKLSIDPYILHKDGSLSYEERMEIKKHVYYTYYALNSMDIFENIKEWAAFHHEYLDGTGYPFHLSSDRLDIGSRIMTVSDIFTALTEDRPYRKGLPKRNSLEIINKMVSAGKLDPIVVKTIINHYEEIDEVRKINQLVASQKYQDFKKILFINNLDKSNISSESKKSFFAEYSDLKENMGKILDIIHFEEVMNNIDDFIIILNKEKRVVFANSKTLRYLDKTLDELINKKVGEVFNCVNSTNDQCGEALLCKNCGADRSIRQSFNDFYSTEECVIDTKEGNELLFKTSSTCIKTDKGEFIVFVLKEIKQEIQSDKEALLFVDALQTMDNSYSFLDALQNGKIQLDTDTINILNNKVALIYQEVEAQRLVTLALDNKLNTNFITVPTETIKTNILLVFGHFKNIDFKFNILEDCIYADRLIISRILLDMVKNAIEIGYNSKTITITIAGDEKNFRISVNIPEVITGDLQDKILKNTNFPRPYGRQITIYCIRLLTEKYLGGSFSCFTCDESGTTFYVEFPNIRHLM
jgi:HD-GYP domain-containing protein (c-di-GMP phosphodiesterase class II)